MLGEERSQCVVISGESGAGKTESAKHVVNQIIFLCGGEESSDGLKSKILRVNPILEAFGNAQTVMNDNSSRFGKYTRLLFDAKGTIMGAQISEYLLEKARVVGQADRERNFHIFYYLFSHPDRARYGLESTDDFRVLKGKPWGDNDAMFAELDGAIGAMGFSPEQTDAIYTLSASLLHLGNVTFSGGDRAAVDSDPSVAARAAELLCVDASRLEEIFTVSRQRTRGEEIKRNHTVQQAEDVRGAVIKAVYGRFFGWIITKINELLAPDLYVRGLEDDRPGTQAARATPRQEIGVLDIYGFENFGKNSFEQICINLAHEQLQYFFNQHTFHLELKEYEAEGIPATAIEFQDNSGLLGMFLNKPIGLLALLDEESNIQTSTPQTLVEKLNKLAVLPGFRPTKVKRDHPTFSIRHFPGNVEYSCELLLEKNRDNLSPDAQDLLQSSKHLLVEDIFAGAVTTAGQVRPRRGSIAEKVGSLAFKKPPTLSTQFKNSLTILVQRMNQCSPHFIRCIKPNEVQQPDNFIGQFVEVQLKYTAVLEAVRIRQEGFAWRPGFPEFVRRFKILGYPASKLKHVKESSRTARRICENSGIKNWHIGKTMMFLKHFHEDELEAKLAQYYVNVIKTQALARAFFARKQWAKMLERKRMSEAERAEAERKETEARRKAEAERKVREKARMEYDLRLAEEQKMAEEARAAAAMAAAKEQEEQTEQQRLEFERQQAEAVKAQAEAAKAEADAKRVADENAAEKAEEAATAALAAASEAECKRQIAEAISAENIEAKKLAEAAVAEAETRQARAEAHQAELEEAASKAKIAHEEAAQHARDSAEAEREARAELEDAKREYDAREKKNAEQMKRLEEEMEEAKAEAEKVRTERMASMKKRKNEKDTIEEKMRIEKLAADWTNEDFNLEERVKSLFLPASCPEDKSVVLTKSTASGPIKKLGHFVRNWKKRWLELDLNTCTIKYYENEKKKKEKGRIDFQDIVRVWAPSENHTKAKHGGNLKNCFLIATIDRVYTIQAHSEDACSIWEKAVGVIVSQ